MCCAWQWWRESSDLIPLQGHGRPSNSTCIPLFQCRENQKEETELSFNEVLQFFWSTAKVTWRHIPSILGPLKDGTYWQTLLLSLMCIRKQSFDFVKGVNARAESHGHLEMLKKNLVWSKFSSFADKHWALDHEEASSFSNHRGCSELQTVSSAGSNSPSLILMSKSFWFHGQLKKSLFLIKSLGISGIDNKRLSKVFQTIWS